MDLQHRGPHGVSTADAEEVAQEVLVKVITQLSTFRGESKFRTWLYRIAANHVLNMKRPPCGSTDADVCRLRDAINAIPDLELPDANSVPVDVPLLVEEAKVGCTMGMLLCLDRKQRLIFTLGEILGASDTAGAEVLKMTLTISVKAWPVLAATYEFHEPSVRSGQHKQSLPLPKKTRGFIDAGHVNPEQLLFVPEHVVRVHEAAAETIRSVDDVVEQQYAAIYREHPFLPSPDVVGWLRRTLSGKRFTHGIASELKNLRASCHSRSAACL